MCLPGSFFELGGAVNLYCPVPMLGPLVNVLVLGSNSPTVAELKGTNTTRPSFSRTPPTNLSLPDPTFGPLVDVLVLGSNSLGCATDALKISDYALFLCSKLC
jgi:hypothetical protein